MIVTVGKDFNIALDSNATTGYQWQLARPLNTKIVRYVKNLYRSNASQNSKMVGVGGKEYWTFRALKKGQTEIVFKYVRPWEKGIKPVDIKTVKISVRGK